MTEQSPRGPAPEEGEVDRWELIRDLLVFQVKLGLDAVRDLILLPISLAAGAVDLILGVGRSGSYFHRVFALGRRTDAWINLFGTYHGDEMRADASGGSVDALVGQVEKLIVDQYERGGVTASAKDAIDRSLDTISRKGPS